MDIKLKGNLCGLAICGPVDFCSEECGMQYEVANAAANAVGRYTTQVKWLTSSEVLGSKDRELTAVYVRKFNEV